MGKGRTDCFSPQPRQVEVEEAWALMKERHANCLTKRELQQRDYEQGDNATKRHKDQRSRFHMYIKAGFGGEGFPAPRLVPFLGRRCGRRGESVWHSKGPLRLMLVRIPSKHVLTGNSDGRYPSRGCGAMHDALRREIPA